MDDIPSHDLIKKAVRRFWGHQAKVLIRPNSSSAAISLEWAEGYGSDYISLPAEIVASSFGCGNPLSYITLHHGDIVIDLGCGSGLDVILASQQVGPEGMVVGIDFAPEMLALAQRYVNMLRINNVKFILADIENLPLQDGFADIVSSNSVIYMVPDKKQALAEAYRILKPGGTFVVADMISHGELPPQLHGDVRKWASWFAGAEIEGKYCELLKSVGFKYTTFYTTKRVM
ncbi:MAG: Demethylmenaquinone methyltransferase [Syntrophomonadaceae bacterium]|nr:Demethylmenaquinone methyltransferase [Bacillota bacterium]